MVVASPLDASGNAYMTGDTSSTDFPTASPIQAAFGGGSAFVTKLNAAGSALVYSTYLGGSLADAGRAIAVDALGNAYVTGETGSIDFPTASFQSTFGGGGNDAFIAKIGEPIPLPPCTYSITPTSASFPASGGTGSVAVAANCTWTAKSNASWITITSDSIGSGGGRVEYSVAANPGASSRTGTLSISGGQTLTVTQAGTTALTVPSGELSFSAIVGAASARQALQVSSDGGTLNWTATVELLNGADWLTISPTSGTASLDQPATITVEVNYDALAAAGIFQAVITLTDTGTDFSVAVPVAVVLSAPGARLLIDPPVFVFTAASTASGSLSRTLRVINQEEGTLDWSISATSGNLPPWLTVSPNTGTAGAGVAQASTTTLTANPDGLSSGVNQVLLQVSAPGASNDPQLVAVTLHVVPATTPTSADINPYGMLFVVEQGGAMPEAQELTVSNVGGGTLTADFVASTESGGEWLMVTPSGGTTSAGPFTAQVWVNPAGLAAGVYRGALTGTFSSGPEQAVEVLFIVRSLAAALRAQAVGLPGSAAVCTPTGLELLATTIGSGLSLPVSFPRVLAALVVDDCGTAVGNATVVASVEGLNIPLRSLDDGFYTGTWAPLREAESVTMAFTALHPSFARVQRSFTVSTAAAAGGVELPVLFDGGVVEGAGFTKRRPLAPGGIISLFGERFATDSFEATQLPLERDLGGDSVRIGDEKAPLFFVSPDQVNAQVPFDLEPGDSVSVAVSVGDQLTDVQNYLIAPVQPGIFIDFASGNATILDGESQPVTPENPARIGDTLQIFCTGLGATEPAVVAGDPAPAAEPLARVTTPVTVTIGGQPAQVSFAGLAPNFAGLYQVNAVVPAGVEPGDAVPLVLEQNGIVANPDRPITIPVQAP